MGFAGRPWSLPWIPVFTVSLLCCGGRAEGPIRYSVLEESEAGTEVGNVARDLGVDPRDLYGRKFRLTYKTKGQYFTVSMKSGALLTKEILDREALCGSAAACVMNLEAVMDNPLEFHRLEVEIVDINDNAPVFPASESRFTITELTLSGAYFPIEGAFDPDIGTNGLCTYQLSNNDFFALKAESSDCKSKSVGLVLKKQLDREQRAEHHVTITAVDGGNPKRSGTSEIIITVQDVNDNTPVFDSELYTVKVPENTALGTLLIKVNATDLDEGTNSQILYSFSSRTLSSIKHLLTIDAENGEIRIIGFLDFEESSLHELHVQARDRGTPAMTAHCKVLVEVVDLNDNAPEVEVTSMSSPVKEDAQPGLVIALFTVTDKDSGVNGEVLCQITNDLPFAVESKYQNYYSLSVKEPLDREAASEYNVTVVATDGGSPSRSAMKTIVVSVSDVNDNPPAFSESSYVISVPENNVPGSHVLQVSALDPDAGDNARIRYFLLENSADAVSILSLFSVHPETGVINALQPFDYEKLQVLYFRVEARDHGSPSLSGITNVTVFIQDVNDNPPTILQRGSGSAADTVLVPRTATRGHIASKIRAIDSDSGHNAWLSYEFKDSTMGTPFKIGSHTGEISLKQHLGESYPEMNELIILVKDHGTPPLSATTTLTVLFVETNMEVKSGYKQVEENEDYPTNLNSYLIISIAFISSIFIFCIILFTTLRCIKARDEKLAREKPDFFHDGAGNLLYSQPQTHQYNLYLAAQSECNLTIRKSKLISQDLSSTTAGGELVGDLMLTYSTAEGGATEAVVEQPKHPNPDWRYSASLRAGVQSTVHMEESAVLRGVPAGLEQQWPTVSSATTEPEGGEVSPPVGAGVNSNSWTFKYGPGPGNQKQPGPIIPPDFPDNFIIPGSPAIISIRQDQPSSQAADKGNFITFGKKEETKKKKKKKKGTTKTTDKKEKGNSTTDNSDQ
ncbi:protocadherin alpha-7-like isoform X4 [Lissotriton helveticus]